MKKIYDKLVLLIAVLALAAGGALYFMKMGDLPSAGSVSAVITTENPYEVVPAPQASEGEVSWPSPEPQSTKWVYDVFTPPKSTSMRTGTLSIRVGHHPLHLDSILRRSFESLTAFKYRDTLRKTEATR